MYKTMLTKSSIFNLQQKNKVIWRVSLPLETQFAFHYEKYSIIKRVALTSDHWKRVLSVSSQKHKHIFKHDPVYVKTKFSH